MLLAVSCGPQKLKGRTNRDFATDVLPLRGTYSFRSMLIDGKNENGKPKVLAASKPFLFGMDVVVSSDTKIDPARTRWTKRNRGSTAFLLQAAEEWRKVRVEIFSGRITSYLLGTY